MPHHGGHPALREDAAAPGAQAGVCRRHATLSTDFEIQVVLGARGVVQSGAPLRKVPGVQLPRGAHAAVDGADGRGGAVARAFTKLMGALLGGEDPLACQRARRSQAEGHPPGVADAAGQPGSLSRHLTVRRRTCSST